jgi:type I restriction enzyme M protein
MLDTDTRRRIDTARDILVGKVPDPKSQVEQITIALIYKFMDDMDAQSEELGGKRKFFTGEFARYGWAKLMTPALGGHEMLGLYAEGITKMPQNPGIPPLFRDIFKNAYLPYRDPETLKSFLKIIDEFSYDHSERLGDAFEYLLSVLGSQGDAGQFRTPRHIIDFIVEIVDPKKTDAVLDPACGTAGFLISSYKHILKANVDANGSSTLTPDEKGRLAQNFKGYDISPDMVRLSLVNMYLHGFTDPHIYEYDTLTSEERWSEFADVILANPPFMSPKGGIKPHKRFSIQAKRSEVLFVDYMLEHLTPHGRAGIIVPEGIIFQNGTAYTKLREVLLNEALIGVISLPSGVFQPYSGVKTSILILDKRVAKSRPTILFSDIRAIGVSLGVKRTITERNDLPHVLNDYSAYYADKPVSSHSWLVERSVILANDCNLSGERYRPVEIQAGTRSVSLKEICSLTKGAHSSTKTDPGPYPLIVTAKEWLTSATYQMEGEAVCVPLISSTGHGRADIKRIHFASGKFALANLLVALQPINPDVLIAKFLYLVLDAQKEKLAGLMKGAANVSMKVEDLAEFQIPLPSLELQKEIVAEIEGYQKVINGARAILKHSRPHIPVHADWPVVPLEEACEIQRGKFSHRPRNDPRFYGGKYPFIQTGDVVRANGGKITYTQTLNEEGLSVSKLFQPPVVVVTIAANIGDTALLDFPSCFPDSVVGLIPKPGTDARFLELAMRTKKQYLNDIAPQAAQKNINIEILRTIEIPHPALGVQQAVVAEIEAEQALIAPNRELISRFEHKIQTTLARIWGEETASTET